MAKSHWSYCCTRVIFGIEVLQPLIHSLGKQLYYLLRCTNSHLALGTKETVSQDWFKFQIILGEHPYFGYATACYNPFPSILHEKKILLTLVNTLLVPPLGRFIMHA